MSGGGDKHLNLAVIPEAERSEAEEAIRDPLVRTSSSPARFSSGHFTNTPPFRRPAVLLNRSRLARLRRLAGMTARLDAKTPITDVSAREDVDKITPIPAIFRPR
jgi:hypothetical protein